MAGFGIDPYGVFPYGTTGSGPPPKISIPHHASYAIQAFTFICDVYVTAAADTWLVGKTDEWAIREVGGNWELMAYKSGAESVTATTPAVYSEWKQLAAVYDGTALYFYVDNTLIGSVAIAPRDNVADVMGAWHTGSVRRMTMWSRALLSAERTSFWTNNTVPVSGLIGQWLMTDGVAGIATDTSSTANDGTIDTGTYIGGQQDGVAVDTGYWVIPVDGAITDATHWITIFGGFYVLDTSLPIDGTPTAFAYHDDFPTYADSMATIHKFTTQQFRVAPPLLPGMVIGMPYPMMTVETSVHEQQLGYEIGRRSTINTVAPAVLTTIGREDGVFAYAQDVYDTTAVSIDPGIYSMQDGPLVGYLVTSSYGEFTKQFTNCIVDSGKLIDYDYWRQGIVEGMHCIINNVRYTVDSIGTHGEITLDTAPPDGTGVTADFYLVGFRYVETTTPTDIGFGI